MAIPKPLAPIRRFDVFAEFNRLRGLKEEGLAPNKAKGYGLWLAKVVAAQKFGRMPRPSAKKKGKAIKREFDKRKWRKLGGVEQTDKMFDRQIVNRMGKPFYNRVFSPAIRKAYDNGRKYIEFRDTIRATWKPE